MKRSMAAFPLLPREENRLVTVNIEAGMLRVMLQDGREIATPLDWYPTLAQATVEQRDNYELRFSGIHWPDLDEDLSIAGMLRGIHVPPHRRALTNPK
jgi:hypothetical protein